MGEVFLEAWVCLECTRHCVSEADKYRVFALYALMDKKVNFKTDVIGY